jgi:hypothetical protein
MRRASHECTAQKQLDGIILAPMEAHHGQRRNEAHVHTRYAFEMTKWRSQAFDWLSHE